MTGQQLSTCTVNDDCTALDRQVTYSGPWACPTRLGWRHTLRGPVSRLRNFVPSLLNPRFRSWRTVACRESRERRHAHSAISTAATAQRSTVQCSAAELYAPFALSSSAFFCQAPSPSRAIIFFNSRSSCALHGLAARDVDRAGAACFFLAFSAAGAFARLATGLATGLVAAFFLLPASVLGPDLDLFSAF